MKYLNIFSMNSIKKKLFITSTLLVAIPLSCVIILLSYSMVKKSGSEYNQRITAEITHISGMLVIFFDGVYGDLNMLGNHSAIKRALYDNTIHNYVNSTTELMNSDVKRGPLEQEIYNLELLVTKSMPDYNGVVFASKTGQYITDNPNVKLAKGFDPRLRPNYTMAMEKNGEPVVVKPFLAATGEYIVFGAQAFKGNDGTFSYIVSIALQLTQLTDKISRIRIGESGYLALTDQDGTILVHPVKDLLGKNISETGVAELTDAVKSGDAAIRYKSGGVDEFARVVTVPKIGWKIIGVIDQSEITAGARSVVFQIIFVGVLFIIIAIILAWITARRISEPITSVVSVLNETAKGDFTVSIDPKFENSRDEVGELSKSFNGFIKKMSETIGEIVYSSQNLVKTVEEIARGNENLSQRTSEQASSLEEIAATIEEANASTKQNAGNAAEARQLAANSESMAVDGGHIVENAVLSIGEINSSSRKISEIIIMINEIAFQTNLLALNAAVEAARAGEQGRGFAVVAGEVRNLAQRSAGAAKEIEKLIEDSTGKIEEGTDLVNKSGDALKEIIQSAKQVNEIISEIAASSDEQRRGIEQINTAITEMDSMTQQNAALVEETASASEEMSNQAQDLLAMVNRFKIRNT